MPLCVLTRTGRAVQTWPVLNSGEPLPAENLLEDADGVLLGQRTSRGAAACCSLVLLTFALLMTPPHLKCTEKQAMDSIVAMETNGMIAAGYNYATLGMYLALLLTRALNNCIHIDGSRLSPNCHAIRSTRYALS